MSSPAIVTAPAASTGFSDPAIDLAGRIDATPLRAAPFDHLYVEKVFPAGTYRALLANLPETRFYRELRNHPDAIQPDGRSARLQFYLFPEHIRLLPRQQRAFWQAVSHACRAPETQEAFKRKFQGPLEARFKRGIDRLNFYPIPILVRDLGGYRIGIHDDSGRKAITVQFYLPRDDRQVHLGTIFHEGKRGDAALRATPLNFSPSTGYAFPVVPGRTWHSVTRTTQADGERNSLMMTYYVQDTLLDRYKERSKRFRALAARPFTR